jgi:hypothetical protein
LRFAYELDGQVTQWLRSADDLWSRFRKAQNCTVSGGVEDVGELSSGYPEPGRIGLLQLHYRY